MTATYIVLTVLFYFLKTFLSQNNGVLPLKIMFFAIVNKKEFLGVAKKVFAQAQALGELGESVFLLLADPSDGIELYRFCLFNKNFITQWEKN